MPLDRILNADSIAVVGASKDPTKRGYQAIRTLLDEKFEGRIYPVNPREERILGLRCYPRVSDIEDPVDIALITTPAATLPAILADCGQKGVPGAVLIAGGFGELGPAGKALEATLVETARRHGVRLIGPNTAGVMNLKKRMNLVGLRGAPVGSIGLLTQSGNMALTLITEAKVKSLMGFTYYIGVGNEADVRFHEYLEFLRQDPDTRAIVMYVEGMREGRKFLQQAYRTTLDKPIVLLKSGRSGAGRRSAGSHTGALAGISEVANRAFKRAGIIRVERSDELFPVTEALASLPPIRNKSVAILADGGGHATIAADLLTDLGIELPELSVRTQARLRKLLPPGASVRNPVDVAGGTDADPTIFAACADIILKDKNAGGLLVVGLFGGYGIRFAESLALMEEDAAHQLGKLVRDGRKPIVLHSLYAFAKPHALHLLRYYGIPVNDSLELSCRCVAALSEYGNYLSQYHARTNFVFDWKAHRAPEGDAIVERARAENRTVLLEHEAKRLFQLHDAPVAPEFLVTTAAEAVKQARRLGGPVALKIVSPDLLHKSEAGAVRLGLRTDEEVRTAFREIKRNARQYARHADLRGVLVSAMAPEGVEVIIGTKIDDQFGPVIVFGLGGVLVEVLRDVSTRVLPISPNSARRMIEELRASALLDGFRGKPPVDRRALIRLLLIVSEVIESYPEIQELDLNPVLLHAEGLSIVDARIILKPEPAPADKRRRSSP